MAVDVIMPQMGESVAEGTIVRWLKQVGDAVDRDEPIFEITTDKVDAEIPAPEAGVLLEIKVQAGETVEVGTPVAVIGAEGESAGGGSAAKPDDERDDEDEGATEAGDAGAAEADRAEAKPAPEADKPRSEMSAAELRRTRSTPVVRKIADEHGVDIGDVDGTGLDGRVTKKDILAYIDSGAAAKKSEAVAAERKAPAKADAARPAQPPAPAQRAAAAEGKVQIGAPMVPVRMRESDSWEPMSRMRRSISDHMIQSKQYSAHVHTCFEIDYGKVDGLRRKYKQQFADRGARLTFTTFLARATIKALQAHPILNSSHDGENIVYRGDINLGIAVALDWGLIVPVVHGADELSMVGLSKKIADLGERARTKKLKPDEVAGVTFSITNPGIFGSQWGTPIIPQPTVAILGVGTIEKRAKVVSIPGGGDAIVPRLCGYLTLGFDHRVIDGAVADQFMVTLKGILESFDDSAM